MNAIVYKNNDDGDDNRYLYSNSQPIANSAMCIVLDPHLDAAWH